jgi:hypothetical protein
MSGFLIVEGEQGMLCLGIKGLSLKEEGALGIASNMVSFNCVLDIDSFILYDNYMLCKLLFKGCRRVLKRFVIIDKARYRVVCVTVLREVLREVESIFPVI